VVTQCNGTGNWTSANETCEGWFVWLYVTSLIFTLITCWLINISKQWYLRVMRNVWKKDNSK